MIDMNKPSVDFLSSFKKFADLICLVYLMVCVCLMQVTVVL